MGNKQNRQVLIIGSTHQSTQFILYKLKLYNVACKITNKQYSNIQFILKESRNIRLLKQLLQKLLNYKSCGAIIIILDDDQKVTETMKKVLKEVSKKNIPVLVYVNSNDEESSIVTKDCLVKELDITLDDLHVQQCCGITGIGLFEGLDYLTSRIDNNNTHSRCIRNNIGIHPI
jgi:ADP-ribosylation factor-like protein 5B